MIVVALLGGGLLFLMGYVVGSYGRYTVEKTEDFIVRMEKKIPSVARTNARKTGPVKPKTPVRLDWEDQNDKVKPKPLEDLIGPK